MTAFFRVRPLVALALAGMAVGASAQRDAISDDPNETRMALNRALADREAAQKRAEKLEADAARATRAAEKTASEAAALAARIQQSEANISAGQARLALVERQRAALRVRLAQKQKPLVELTASLQNFSRRPVALSLLRPGSVREVVYLRAMLASTLPQVERRTAALRSEIAQGKALEQQARQGLASLRSDETELVRRREALATLETRQRLASREASGTAAREAERALALAEQARDLDSLVVQLDKAGSLRRQLAALDGPIARPARPQESQIAGAQPVAPQQVVRPPSGYQLPVAGRVVAGFGAITSGGIRNEGVTFATRPAAQVVAPASGRIAFAGAYRGYGQIVILEHPGGWITLVTGLARVSVAVGDRLVGGAPLGVAGPARPTVTLELRRAGEAVNPMEYLG
ncbi:peptidase M23 family protein [Caenibius tardaugens NBRC 16725]|uniref:Peptidase M23 family protein n=1 Tax=Caenibius tardaugens NBRC 16725 TaxID=1219035 RepID=U2YKW8_9SPHN|nr:peptidoglycan DD-metalloendopeptidase family protein [Caenibius tardaugens]GAD48972.1 peptidase M23 family protein [Caenibius tardaugens NBRC 16725]